MNPPAARTLRLDLPHAGDNRRWLVGIAVSSRCHEVSAALIGVGGRGLDTAIDIIGTRRTQLPREVWGPVNLSGAEPVPVEAVAEFRSHLADVEASLIGELLRSLGIAPQRILAVGAVDPGVWKFDHGGPCGYLGLCDAPRLAELSGLNVIDAFPARDLIQGGQGGPITALPDWLLLRDRARNRVLLDLGRTTRICGLPSSTTRNAVDKVLAFDVGPGSSLLDHLANKLTGGQQHFDSGGRLAVQGKQIPELVAFWLQNPYFDRPLPRWHPRGVRPERFLTDAMRQAAEHGWSVQDMLCSATHFIAQAVADALARRLQEEDTVDDVVVAGGGQQNGMLLREIGERVGKPLVRAADILNGGDELEAASAAVLALLHLDQIPANLPAVTGAGVSRLLGSLTPGAPQNWQRLLQAITEAAPTVRTLRAAL